MSYSGTMARRILAVDDDVGLLALLRLVLEDEGHTVATAGSLIEALAVIRAGHPDLVICDVRMPDAPPFALLDALRANPATISIPVLVCSGAVRELEEAGEQLVRPGVAVLAKPFDLDDLSAAVERLVAPGGASG